MTPAAGAGVSIGTIALIGGVVVVAGVVYLLYKNSNKSNNTVSQLVTDEDQYKGDKNIVINAIKEKDWDLLEELLKDKSFQQYPDLIKMVKEALEERK
ncbi:hypothetical protein ACN5O4_05945 [Aliarcobacter butzleri]|uniref:hypothetical protein n=1 Tax=Aliarcobacter butzleri TaxID=28197 RepID=UPI003AF8343A